MKYKILINSSSPALLRDFFTNSDTFTCMSTSGYWTDICIHYELFKPDAYVCLAEYADTQIVSRLKRLKTTPDFSDVPVIVITNEDCFEFYTDFKEKDLTIDLLLSRPITISAISDGVTRLLKSILKKKKNVSHRNKLKPSGRQQKLLQRRQPTQDRIFSLSTTIKMS